MYNFCSLKFKHKTAVDSTIQIILDKLRVRGDNDTHIFLS